MMTARSTKRVGALLAAVVLTGVDGFAQGPEDMPDEIGEGTTFQKSVRPP